MVFRLPETLGAIGSLKAVGFNEVKTPMGNYWQATRQTKKRFAIKLQNAFGVFTEISERLRLSHRRCSRGHLGGCGGTASHRTFLELLARQ